jgi:hypothetical protein
MASGINVCDAWVYMHGYRNTILYEYLFQEHAGNLARFDISVWDEETIWPV